MLKEQRKALIVGASGLVGNSLLKTLLKELYYNEIEFWVRKPLGMSFLILNEKIIDFDTIETLPITPVDHVYCCLGTTINKAGSQAAFRKVDFDSVVQAAKYAEKAGASKFIVVSSMGANPKSSNFYLRTKGEMEEALKSLSIPCICILQPSLLLGNRNEFRFGEVIAQKLMGFIGFLFFGKLKKYKGIKARVVAKAMLQLAKQDKVGLFTYDSAMIHELGDI